MKSLAVISDEFSVFARRHIIFFRKNPVEVSFIMVSCLFGNFGYG